MSQPEEKNLLAEKKTVMGDEEEHGMGQMANMGEEEQASNMEPKKEVVAKQETSTVEVMSPEVEAELLDLVVSLGNVTCTFNVGCGLNLVELVLHGVNVENEGGRVQQDHDEVPSGC